jgi:hypothetical protein
VPQHDASPEAAFWKEDHVTEIAEGAAVVLFGFQNDAGVSAISPG